MSDLLENLRDRVVDLEAQQQVLFTMLVAAVATHPEPAKWREAFAQRAERLTAHDLHQPLPEGWLDAQGALQRALLTEFDRAISALR